MRACVETCARGAGTHGDVLNVHTGTCSLTHTTHTTQQNTTHHTHTQHHTEKETERETEKEDRDNRREDKRRQDKTREERNFIFRVVVHGRFWLVQ